MRDPYLYPDVDVLINKKDIKDSEALNKLEEDVVPLRMIRLRKEGLNIKSVFDIQKIHSFLFSSIFDWAGEFRKITMYKKEPILNGCSVDYTPFDYIEKETNNLENKFKGIVWQSLSNKEKINNVCSIVQELWQIHCFREGNTRSVALFLYFLLKTIGVHINIEFLGKNAKYFRNALVLASLYSASKPEYLFGIIADCTTIKNLSTNRYETINGYHVDKYSYQNHTAEKIKTIKDIKE
ncbi:MAG: Fic family protein [Bacilli bacterium]|nr:Fic family protein [Bacilli bacterium]